MVGWEALPDMSQGPFLLPPSNFPAYCVSHGLAEPILWLFFPTVQPSGLQGHYVGPSNTDRERRSQEGECTVLTCENDHVHPPKYAHDPADHDDGRQDLDEGGSDVQPEDAAHVPVREVGAGPTQHGERRHERSWGESSSTTPTESHGLLPDPSPQACPPRSISLPILEYQGGKSTLWVLAPSLPTQQ